jgi:hypothetical protein
MQRLLPDLYEPVLVAVGDGVPVLRGFDWVWGRRCGLRDSGTEVRGAVGVILGPLGPAPTKAQAEHSKSPLPFSAKAAKN